MTPKISIVVQAHNEEKTISEVVKRVNNLRRGELSNYDIELILVNDGSTDGTWHVMKEMAKEYDFVRIAAHQERKGLTRALKTGFSLAKGDIIIFIPADMQSDPQEDVPKLLKAMENGYDMVVGWRVNRRFPPASKVYNFVLRTLFGLNIHDADWIKAFKREVMKCFVFEPGFHRYLVLFAKKAGFKIGEIEVKMHPRMFGGSKYGLSKIFKGLLDLFKVMIFLRKIQANRR